MSQFRRLIVAAAVAATGACAHAANLAPSTSPLRHLDTAQRRDAIGRAQVWTATDVPAIHVNDDYMRTYRPLMEPYYYDSKKYGSYLDQLGIKFPNPPSGPIRKITPPKSSGDTSAGGG